MKQSNVGMGFIFNSISKKAIIPILFFLIIGMGIVIAVSQSISNQVVVDIVIMNTNETTSMIRKQLIDWVNEKQASITTISKNTRIGDSVPDSFMGKMLRTGTVDQLIKIQEESESLLNISVANLTGDIVMSSVESEETINVSEESFFKSAKNKDRKPIMVFNPKTNSMNMVLSELVFDKNQENVGILIGWIDFNAFEKRFLKDLKFGKSGYLSLVDQKTSGIIGIGDWEKRSYIGTINLRDYEWGTDMLEQSAELSDGERGVIHYSWKEDDGTVRDKIAAFQPISEFGWIITGEAYLDELTEKSVQATYISVGITVALLLVISGMLIWFLRFLVLKPVENFTKAIIHAEQTGDFSIKTEISTLDELGKAAGAFDSLTESLQASLQSVNQVMSGMAQADLTNTIETEQKGDLADLKNNINESMNLLNQAMSQLVFLTDLIDAGTSELSDSAQALAQGASDQAASLEEITSSMNDVESQTSLNNENSNQASELSMQTMEIVDNGNKQMELMLNSMETINLTSQKVTKVIKVIDEIAFQTNLLALNAAVEAARAGKYGKGFAVVADEVRNLANRSTNAAKETTDLIETSVKEIENGVKNADQTALVLTEIQNSVGKVNDLVNDITKATADQKDGIMEINRALDQINNVVMRNSSISEETASSSEELSKKANDMKQLMARFRIKKQFQNQLKMEDDSIKQLEQLG